MTDTRTLYQRYSDYCNSVGVNPMQEEAWQAHDNHSTVVLPPGATGKQMGEAIEQRRALARRAKRIAATAEQTR